MFSLETLIIFIIYAAVLYFGRRIQLQLASRTSPRPGLILPALAWIVAMVLSVQNFIIAFDVQFSLFAFLASVVLFVFYAVPAMYFSLLYIDGRKDVKLRQQARAKRMRQARTQQRVQPNLQQRYESPLVKQEPIIYMPEARTRRSPAAQRRPASRQNPRITANNQALRTSRQRKNDGDRKR